MAIIRLGLRFPTGSSSLPGNYGGPPWRTSIEASPYRARPLGGAAFPYLALLHVGFAKPIRYRTAGALLPHLFTLTVDRGGMFSVALSVPYGPSHYEARCPVEFGLSSANTPRSPVCLPIL